MPHSKHHPTQRSTVYLYLNLAGPVPTRSSVYLCQCLMLLSLSCGLVMEWETLRIEVVCLIREAPRPPGIIPSKTWLWLPCADGKTTKTCFCVPFFPVGCKAGLCNLEMLFIYRRENWVTDFLSWVEMPGENEGWEEFSNREPGYMSLGALGRWQAL